VNNNADIKVAKEADQITLIILNRH
jgi:hypothetical protein